MLEKLSLLITIMGGIGLFLLGMVIMTDGLRDLAGKSIRRNIMAFTSSPFSGVMCGALSTAVIQSSSAVTVATVGFVRAGLMDFSHALGVIFGANIGTTITGWLVLLFGFKLKIGLLVFPIIFFGVLMKLFAPSRLGAVGLTLAGFGLIFTGIDTLQSGLSDLRTAFDFAQYPAVDFLDRLSVAAVGIVFTLITQSSSAGVASTLVALYAGLISFDQAAALVVGMDVGTSVTAALATIGASVETKRAGFSHVIYNILTGVVAILLIPLFILGWEFSISNNVSEGAEIALIAFHSLFNIVGVMLILPFIRQFVSLMVLLFPDNTEDNVLDRSLLQHPEIALDATNKALFSFFASLTFYLTDILQGKRAASDKDLEALQQRISQAESFIDEIDIANNAKDQRKRLIESIHSLDHIQRLLERIDDEPSRILGSERPEALHKLALQLNLAIKNLQQPELFAQWQNERETLRIVYHHIKEAYQPLRETLLNDIASDNVKIPEATNIMDAYRWLARVAEHLYKITTHLNNAIPS